MEWVIGGEPSIRGTACSGGITKTITSDRRKADARLWSNYGPVIVSQCSETAFRSHPCRGFSISYDRILSRQRPRVRVPSSPPFLSSTCVNFGQTIEDPKGHGLVPFFVSIFAPDNSRRWSSRRNATRYRR